MLKGRRSRLPFRVYQLRRWGLWLSALYVLGCAFRSFFPVADVPRICLVDSWASSILLGRSVATVAELAFVAQCALLLYEAGWSTGTGFAVGISRLLVPLILVAEVFSWFALLTKNYAGAVVEESLWTLSAVLMTCSLLLIWPRVTQSLRPVLVAVLAFSLAYVLFMVTVDIPMYYSRLKADLAAGTAYLSLLSGFIDAAKPCTVTSEWTAWREELNWLLPYFTAAVWFSIALTHTPWPIGSSPGSSIQENTTRRFSSQ
jgi:hypothetical protein